MNLSSICKSFAGLSTASTFAQTRAAAVASAPAAAVGAATKSLPAGDSSVLRGGTASSELKWSNPGAEAGIIVVGGKPAVGAGKLGEKNGIIIVSGKPSAPARTPGLENGIIIVGGRDARPAERSAASLAAKHGIIIVSGKAPSANSYSGVGYQTSITDGVKGLQDGLTKDSELSMVQLQSVVSQHQLAVQMATQLMSKMNESTKQVAGNIG